MAPVQEILNIQYAFMPLKLHYSVSTRLEWAEQEPHYPHLENPFLNKKTVSIRVDNLHFSYGEEKILNGYTVKN